MTSSTPMRVTRAGMNCSTSITAIWMWCPKAGMRMAAGRSGCEGTTNTISSISMARARHCLENSCTGIAKAWSCRAGHRCERRFDTYWRYYFFHRLTDCLLRDTRHARLCAQTCDPLLSRGTVMSKFIKSYGPKRDRRRCGTQSASGFTKDPYF